MLRLCHFLFQVQVYAVVFVRCIAATPQYTTRLDWQCWPLDVQVFAEFSCSLDGVSYPIANVPRGKIHLSSTDERTTSATWPWSYPAVCTGYVPEADSPLCIFTNTAFDDGRGISFIITPRLAAELASTLTFEDDSLKCSTLFQVAEDAGSKGRSAIIERNITGGEQIAYNMPILVRDWAINKLSYLERENLLCRAILQLPTMTQRLLDGLTSFHNPAYFLSGIVANHGGFTLDMDNRGHSLLFPEMAFFNHDCAPKSEMPLLYLLTRPATNWKLSSQVRIDPTTLSMSVTAARDISEGQEITISCKFHSLFLSTSSRSRVTQCRGLTVPNRSQPRPTTRTFPTLRRAPAVHQDSFPLGL